MALPIMSIALNLGIQLKDSTSNLYQRHEHVVDNTWIYSKVTNIYHLGNI